MYVDPDHHPTAHPLAWPEGWVRTPKEGRISSSKFRTTFAKSVDALLSELRALQIDESSVVISTNIPVRRDGMPYAGRKATSPDPGVAVYWQSWNGRRRAYESRAMACDRYDTVLGNIRGITLTLNAFRAIARHGSSDMLDRAFSGFSAIPEKAGLGSWCAVLGFTEPPPDFAAVRAAHRELISTLHPDLPDGDAERAAEINQARDDARIYYGE